MKTLCQTFRQQAGATWNRSHRAAALQLFMGEETITETVLYEIARQHQSGDYLAIPATKASEAKHGADWFWWFGDTTTGIGFRVQAKKLFPSGRYESLRKKSGDPYEQLKKLVKRAKKANQTPLYCFYNFNVRNFARYQHDCGHGYKAPSYWGCALALPEDVQRQNSDLLFDLQDFMLPWHFLVCTDSATDLAEAAIGAGKRLAAAKPSRKLESGRVQLGRDRLDVRLTKQKTPGTVVDIIEIQERSRPVDRQVEGWLEINERAQGFLSEQNVGGLAIFNDTRFG